MRVNEPKEFICKICGRDTPRGRRMRHHLVPKQKGGMHQPTIDVCGACGSHVHKMFTNKDLATKYNTLEKLKDTDEIKKWIKWVSKTDRFKFKIKDRRGKNA